MKVRPVAYVLVVISIVGVIAIPTGNPMFLERAIAIEIAFITLAVLTFMGYRKHLYACIPLATVVIIGNSLAPPHVEIMTTFSKPLNAAVLITGGYILQAALVVATVHELVIKRNAMQKVT
ncbi:MAG: hypothetical protein ACREAY_04540 [Nitrososphaera sp.]|uniref:hypothetical protein n=1 Tax=Nitrososphaera sp. TaxID=1971748 RepID=UPI003D6F7FA1